MCNHARSFSDLVEKLERCQLVSCCNGRYHCPLCTTSTFKPAVMSRVQLHLEDSHWSKKNTPTVKSVRTVSNFHIIFYLIVSWDTVMDAWLGHSVGCLVGTLWWMPWDTVMDAWLGHSEWMPGWDTVSGCMVGTLWVDASLGYKRWIAYLCHTVCICLTFIIFDVKITKSWRIRDIVTITA